ncbi:MAG: Biotin synthase, partial [uncultured Solirubrobacteraceae bacterium]
AVADHPRGSRPPGRADRPRRHRGADRAGVAGPRRALRRLDRHVLAGQRQVRRLRRGLRLLRAVALRRGRDADARADGARADPRARPRRRGGRRAPLLHGHTGSGAVQAGVREGARGSTAGGHRDQPQALRVGRPPVGLTRASAQGGGHPAGPPQRRDRPLALSRGLLDRPLRGPAADDRRRARRRPGDLRRRHPQSRRDARAARRDGLRALGDQPDVGADQPAQPPPGHEVRRSRVHGSVGGGQVDRDLPPDPPRGALPAVRRTRREHPRAPGARRQGGHQRRDARQLPDHAGQHPRAGPRDVRGGRAQRRPPGRQRRQSASGQPLGLVGGRDARRRRRARRRGGAGARGHAVGSLAPAALPQEGGGPAAPRRLRQRLALRRL